jgi:hypothetical protein
MCLLSGIDGGYHHPVLEVPRYRKAVFPIIALARAEAQIGNTDVLVLQLAQLLVGGGDGATHFLMKTLPRVATETALHVLAYNLTRVMNIMGIQPLMTAMRA